MFPLKVQRGAARRGLGAPQAAPGLPAAGGAAGKEGGRRRAGAGRRRRRPPTGPEEAERRRAGGAGCVPRLRTPRPWTAARTPPGLGRAAAPGGHAELGKPRSRRVASRSRSSCCRPRQPRRLAGSRAALAGAPRRRGDNGGRQSAGAARAPSPSLPPRRLNPFAAPAAPAADAPEAPARSPSRRGPGAWGASGTGAGRLFEDSTFLQSLKAAPDPETTCGGGAAMRSRGGKAAPGRLQRTPDAYLALGVTGQAPLPPQLCPHSTLWRALCPFF